MNTNPLLRCDFYKTGHIEQYPEGLETIYTTYIPRKSRLGTNYAMFVGLQWTMKYLQQIWKPFFENKDKALSFIGEYYIYCKDGLGREVKTEQFMNLFNLGHLPLCIKALPEGTATPIRVPFFVMYNTVPGFGWLVQFIETDLSNHFWKFPTSATIACEYRKIINKALEISGVDKSIAPFMGHDFSYRGMSGYEDAVMSGIGHLVAFSGTDTIPAIAEINENYGYSTNQPSWGFSVAATEHSTACAYKFNGEFDYFKRLLTEVYPTGIVSIVSDTYNLWKVLTDFNPRLKEIILNRKPNGNQPAKVVFRPDSGNPELIICGDPNSSDPNVKAGTINLLLDVFGYTMNDKGFKVLNPAVGAIYGDSITRERAQAICDNLISQGICPSCLVYGIGSFTYVYVSRDSVGQALKATFAVIDGENVEMFKDPITDSGEKKSLKGICKVVKHYGYDGEVVIEVKDQQPDMNDGGEMKDVFLNGEIINPVTWEEVRERTGVWS